MIFRIVLGFVFCILAIELFAQGKSIDEILGKESEEVYIKYSIKYSASDTIITRFLPAQLWKDIPRFVPANLSISIDSEHFELVIEEKAANRKKYRIDGWKSENSIEYIWLSWLENGSFIRLIINKKRNIILYIDKEDEKYHLIYHLY